MIIGHILPPSHGRKPKNKEEISFYNNVWSWEEKKNWANEED